MVTLTGAKEYCGAKVALYEGMDLTLDDKDEILGRRMGWLEAQEAVIQCMRDEDPVHRAIENLKFLRDVYPAVGTEAYKDGRKAAMDEAVKFLEGEA